MSEEIISMDVYKLIKQLQQENKELKQWDHNKDSRNSRQRVANAKLIKENEELKDILNKLESWLEEEQKKRMTNDAYEDLHNPEYLVRQTLIVVLNKLKELKDSDE